MKIVNREFLFKLRECAYTEYYHEALFTIVYPVCPYLAIMKFLNRPQTDAY